MEQQPSVDQTKLLQVVKGAIINSTKKEAAPFTGKIGECFSDKLYGHSKKPGPISARRVSYSAKQ